METVDLLKIAELDFNEFENVITENPNLITTKDSNDRLLLHWCALKGRERSVEHLISLGNCPINAIDDTHNTPLILAALKGNLKIVELLTKNGAEIDAKNLQGHSSLQYVCSKGWIEIVKYLLKQNADVNVKDSRGDTPLHRLASLGRTEILKFYIENEVKPILDCANREGNTPLHYACDDDEVSCALLLVEHGASPLVLNKEEKTPLDLCKPGLRRSIKEKCGIE